MVANPLPHYRKQSGDLWGVAVYFHWQLLNPWLPEKALLFPPHAYKPGWSHNLNFIKLFIILG